MTKYVVLRRVEGSESIQGIDESPSSWEERGTVEASTERRAKEIVSERDNKDGVYVAVAALYFKPEPIEMDRTPRAVFKKSAAPARQAKAEQVK